MEKIEFEKLKLELSINAKNGLDFIASATFVWLLIAFIWALPYSSYNKSIFTFMSGSITIPLAWLFSKILKTSWKTENNPLEPLGLWLNFAQLFYFPFLVFVLLKYPDFFVMSFAIITGAHFFPYAWYYKSNAYAIMAGVISVGSMMIGLMTDPEKMYFIGWFMVFSLAILAVLLFLSYKNNEKMLRSIVNKT